MASGSRTIRLGAWLWLSAVQFFVAQPIVASAWTTPFDLAVRNISDLGSTRCEPVVSVCSPWHAAMNASFIAIGVTMSVGAFAARAAFAPGWRRDVAIAFFTVAGLGVILVGVFPENERLALHATSAGVNFLTGNLALMFFALALRQEPGRPWFASFSAAAGAVGLLASALFAAGDDLRIGPGAMERLAAYPMAIWQIIAGVRLLRYPLRATLAIERNHGTSHV